MKFEEFSNQVLMFLYLVFFALLVVIIIGLISPNDNTPVVNPQGMVSLNIYCSSSHNHPLFQNYTICGYIPDLKERLSNG